MMIKMRNIFSSIAIKLFLSFWLITITSIGLTRFVSTQIEQQSNIVTTHARDLNKLENLQKRINQRKPDNLQIILNRDTLSHRTAILIKEVSTNKVFYNKKRMTSPLASFLATNSLTSLSSIQFPFARITGPKLINVNNKSYQLYLAVRSKHAHFGSMFMQLPFWIRFIIPLVVSLSLCWLLARSFTRPILAIKKAAIRLGNGHYDERVQGAHSRSDELGAMSKSFNKMADKLETNINAHQRLLADVSHELRSPMTRLQLALGIIEKSIEQGKNVDKHLARCEREISQLDSMISNVLSLSRMENTFQKANIETLPFDSIVKLVVDDAQFLADEKFISVTIKENVPCHLAIDKALILGAINNILINAIKHSAPNSNIDVSSKITATNIIITITDFATGVPEDQLDLLFKPFYRVSTARDRETGGTGLGLAIAKQAIDVHQGTISANNNDKGGLTITIGLPYCA
jgi:two-component system sensor histidine kinase CpxA